MSRTMSHARLVGLAKAFDDATIPMAIERAKPRSLRDATARLLWVVHRETSPRSLERIVLASDMRAHASAIVRWY